MFSHYAFSLVVTYSEYLMTVSLEVTVLSEYPFAFQLRGIPMPPQTNAPEYSRSDLVSSSEESCCTLNLHPILYYALLPTVIVSFLKLHCSLYSDHRVGVVFVEDFMFTAV